MSEHICSSYAAEKRSQIRSVNKHLSAATRGRVASDFRAREGLHSPAPRLRSKRSGIWRVVFFFFFFGPSLLLLLLSRFSHVRLVRPHRRQPTRLPRPWDSPGKNASVGCHFLLQCMKVKSEREVAQSCPTPSDPMDCSPPGPTVRGIFQARVLEWGAIVFSVGPSLRLS